MNQIQECRLCGNAAHHTIDIWNGYPFTDRPNENELSSRIFYCLGVQVRRSDGASKICQSCFDKVDRFSDFRRSCISQNDIRLMRRESFRTIEIFSSSSDEEDAPIPTECGSSYEAPANYHATTGIMCIDVTDTDSDQNSREQIERRKSKKKKGLTHSEKLSAKSNEIFNPSDEQQFPIKCSRSLCLGTFENEFARKDHLRTYHAIGRQKSFECYICRRVKQGINSLRQHMNALHGQQIRFTCSVPGCSALFKFTTAMPAHMRLVHSDKLQFVSNKSKPIVNGKLQNVNLSGASMVKCSWKLCPTFFDSQNAMVYHVVTYHAKGNKKVFECYLCQYIAGDRSDINRHMNLKHSHAVSYKCPMPGCRRTFYGRSTYRFHMNSTHAGKRDRSRKNTEFTIRCRTKGCRERFRNKIEVSIHMKTYHRQTKKTCFQCHLCRTSISNVQKLKRHLNLAHKLPSNMPCPMPECDLKFATISAIGTHLRYHHGQSQTFHCVLCAKVLLSNDSFMTHMSKIHGK